MDPSGPYIINRNEKTPSFSVNPFNNSHNHTYLIFDKDVSNIPFNECQESYDKVKTNRAKIFYQKPKLIILHFADFNI